jgi:hypothetical protein
MFSRCFQFAGGAKHLTSRRRNHTKKQKKEAGVRKMRVLLPRTVMETLCFDVGCLEVIGRVFLKKLFAGKNAAGASLVNGT